MDYVEVELNLPKPPSLNMIYAGKHWTYRKKKKDEYKKICIEELSKIDAFTCEAFRMVISYNSRLDIDNGILVSKFLSDTLVNKGIVKDDGNKYYKRLDIRIDKDLPKDSFKVKIKCYD